MREIKTYSTMDEVVASVASVEEIEGVYASVVEEDIGFIGNLIAFFTSHWSEKIYFVIGVIFFFGAHKMGIPQGVALLILLAGILLYLYVKGIRINPSPIIVTRDKVYLIDEVVSDKNTNTVTYDNIDICKRSEVSTYFKFSQLNPFYHITSQHFKMKDKKYIVQRSLLTYFIFQGLYPKKNGVSFSSIKSLLRSK